MCQYAINLCDAIHAVAERRISSDEFKSMIAETFIFFQHQNNDSLFYLRVRNKGVINSDPPNSLGYIPT